MHYFAQSISAFFGRNYLMIIIFIDYIITIGFKRYDVFFLFLSSWTNTQIFLQKNIYFYYCYDFVYHIQYTYSLFIKSPNNPPTSIIFGDKVDTLRTYVYKNYPLPYYRISIYNITVAIIAFIQKTKYYFSY